jgi:high-affinity iron transporter
MAQAGQVERARRLVDITAIAIDEYSLGVVGGRVVSQAELEEAELFLEEALALAGELPGDAGPVVGGLLEKIVAGVAARRPAEELRPLALELKERLAAALGLALDPLPRKAPSLALAARRYREQCSSCHGLSGDGRGPLASALDPPPADFTDPALRDASPLDFFRKINVGVAGTAMPGFSHSLSEEERWALALYASNFRYRDSERAAGEALLRERCPECLVQLSGFAQTAVVSDDSLAVWIRGRLGPELPDSLLRAAVAYARTAAAMEFLGSDIRLAARRVVEATRAKVAVAVERARGGDRVSARREVLDGYLVFEGIEARVRARSASAAAGVERAFADLRVVLGSEHLDPGALERAALEVDRALDRASQVLSRRESLPLLFGQSLVIILREGLEAILIIGALVAFLARAGAEERKREIGYGVLAALGASLLTAGAYAVWFARAAASREVLEGVTMLVAAVVLFWVSYWLVSKIEVRKWQEFVASRMSEALSSRRAWGLAAVAFLAVYREGFETVLFYAALFASSEANRASAAAIFGGIAAGSLFLFGVYWAMQRYGRRIPLRPFFATTSALLYVMAFSFVGQGIAELQEAGYLPATALSWLPAVPALGIFPTLQTFAFQAAMLVAVALALGWVFWVEPRRARVS